MQKKPSQTQQHPIYSNLWPSYKSPTYRPFLFPMEFLTRLRVKIKVIVCRFTYFQHTHPIFSYLYSRNVKKETGKDSWKFIQAIDYNSQEDLHNKRILLCSQKHSEYAIIEDTKWIYAGDYIVYLILLRLIIIHFFLYLGIWKSTNFTGCLKTLAFIYTVSLGPILHVKCLVI